MAITSTHARIIGNGIRLGGTAQSFNAEWSVGTADATPIDQDTDTPARKHTVGVESGTFSAEGFLDGDEDGTYAMLARVLGANSGVIAGPIGDDIGKPAVAFRAGTTKAGVAVMSGANVGYSVEGESQGAIGLGVIASPWQEWTAAGNGSAYDAGAATTGAATVFLAAGLLTGSTVTVTLQHSTTEAGTYVDAASFTVTADHDFQRVDIAAGTLNRWRRIAITAGTFTSIHMIAALDAQ